MGDNETTPEQYREITSDIVRVVRQTVIAHYVLIAVILVALTIDLLGKKYLMSTFALTALVIASISLFRTALPSLRSVRTSQAEALLRIQKLEDDRNGTI